MTMRRVIWEIDIDTDSPQEAAEEALRIQRDPASIATVFDVVDEDGNKTKIDLLEESDRKNEEAQER